MLPRASRVRLTALMGATMGRLLNAVAPTRSSYAWRDKVQAFRAPLTLLFFQAGWLFIVFVGFALMFWASSRSRWTKPSATAAPRC